MSEDRAKRPLVIAEFVEICRHACAQLNARATVRPTRDDYWRAVCEDIGERIGVDPAVVTPANDYPLAVSEVAAMIGLDEHEAVSTARAAVEDAIARRNS